MATLFMFVYKMATVLDKAKLVKFVHETRSIVAAQRKFGQEFNRAPPHRNFIKKWVKQVREVYVMLRKKHFRPKVPDQSEDAVRTEMLISPCEHTSVRRLSLELQFLK